MRCPSCGSEVPEGARFCSTCGHALRPPTDERRIVTVLFGDLVGFTGLSEARDPESVKNLVDRCFERLTADLSSFGGRLDKIVGDALVGLFGAPVAHEDDAERAVRAALQMQRTLDQLGSDLGVQVRMRIGVNTGEVLVGALRAGGDYTAMGDVVNTASRLQTVAAPGDVVVGPETFAATRDVFRYEPLGDVVVRGREGEVGAWTAVEALTSPGRRPRRVRTPLVGRDAEVGLLCSALETATTYRRPHLALVVGEAGMGKSRLAEEVADTARDRHGALVLEGRSVPYGEANPWWPMAEALRPACDFELEDDAATARPRCLAAVATALGASGEAPEVARTAEALLYLMGYGGRLADMDPGRAREEVGRAVRTFVEALAAERPVLLMLSDVQWADVAVLELLDDLLSRLHRLPVILLLTARPDIEERWRPTPGRHNLVVLNLDPLDVEASEQLVAALLDGAASVDVRDLLVERSGGNPFFLEELARLLAESGALRHVPRGAVPILPATLRGLVAARLDALPPTQRAVIEDAAVLGRRGPVTALEALAATRPVADAFPDALEALVDRELLAVSDGTVGFASDLVREVAYGTLTKAERARRHANLACWLDERVSEKERTDEVLEELARHSAAAAEMVREVGQVDGVPGDMPERALDALRRAAERAEDRDNHLAAARFWDQAVRLVGRTPGPERRHALIGRARAQTALRDLDQARADLEVALEEAGADGDDLALARALTVQGDLERNDGDLTASEAVLDRALELWRRLGDRKGEASALRRKGLTNLFSGDLDAAEAALLEAFAAFSELGVRKGLAWANQNLAWIAFYRGEQDVAEERLRDSAALFGDIGDWGGLGWAMGMLGWVRYARGHREEAEGLALQTVEEARESGDRWAVGMMTVLLASIRLWQGRAEEATVRASEARAVFQGIADPWGECRALLPLSRALLVVGRRDEALAVGEKARELSGQLRRQDDMALPDMLLAGLAVHEGDASSAMASLAAARRGGSSAEAMVDHEWASLNGLALVQVGRAAEAVDDLARLARLDEDPGPLAAVLCVLSLAQAAADRPAEAQATATRVAGIAEATYLDRVYALLAEGCAAARLGLAEPAVAALDEAVRVLGATDDRLTPAIVSLARGRVLEAVGDGAAADALARARIALDQLEIAADGWDTAFRLATGT